jgi:hypothetical protein
MKYETPKLTALAPAINAVQSTHNKNEEVVSDSPDLGKEAISAYMDWE